MKRILLISILVLSGCIKGKAGDKGDSGSRSTFSYQGPIINNDFFVGVSALNSTSSISVYIGTNGVFSPLNSWSPSLDRNIYFVANTNNNLVEIINAQSTGLTTYKIVVTNGISGTYRRMLD